MSQILIHPTYFPNVSHYVLMNFYKDQMVFENEDNYQKQTYRNRTHIYGTQGVHTLTVPIKHTRGLGRQKSREIRIDNSCSWQRRHQRSIEMSYRSSAFYEFFEEKINIVFNKKFDFLLDLNYTTLQLVNDCLNLKTFHSRTTKYDKTSPNHQDFRSLVNAKTRRVFGFSPYYQIFSDTCGFIENMSILDLMFNEGLSSLDYLHKNLDNILYSS